MTRMAWLAPLAGTVLLAFLAARPAAAGEQQIVLTEQLNVEWKRELVSYPVSFPERACHPDSVRLTGPDGTVACQLADVVSWPNGPFVKTAKLWFLADLPPRERNTYTLAFGPEPASAPQPKTDLTVKTGQDQVQITTSHVGVRLPVVEKPLGKPVPPEDVPGPVLAMRTADGRWFGGSRLYGKSLLKRASARLVGSGPVLGAVAWRYEYADGNVMEVTVRVITGDNAIDWSVNVKKEAAQTDGFRVNLSRNLAPLVFRSRAEAGSKRPQFRRMGPQAKGKWHDLPLAEYPPGLLTNLTPWYDHWNDYTQVWIRLKQTDSDGELHISKRDPGVWVEPVAPNAEGNFPGARQRKQHKLLPVMKSPQGHIYLDVNAAEGRRTWSILDSRPQYSPKDLARLEAWSQQREHKFKDRRHALVGRRLNKVKDYVLDWKDQPGRQHPRLYMSRKQLEAIWARGKPAPKLLKAIPHPGAKLAPRPHGTDEAALARYLVTGDLQVARRWKLPERLRLRLGHLGQFLAMTDTMTVLNLYDALIDTPLVSPSERKLYRAQMAYLGYRFSDPEHFSRERGYAPGNPNKIVSEILNLGMIGCLIPDHPMADEWVRDAVSQMDRWMEQIGPAGEWRESFHYTDVTARIMMVFAVAARNAGFRDYFKEGSFKKLGLYTSKLYTPPDPMWGNLRAGPPLGRGPAGRRKSLPAALAQATRRSDPAYSKVQQWTWKELGYEIGGQSNRFGGWAYVYFDPSLPAERPDWQTELFPRTGVVMRHGFGTPHEHYMLMVTAGADRVFVLERPAEAGGVSKLFAKGRPLGSAPSGGYSDRHELLMNGVCLARAPVKRAKDLEPYGYDSDSRVRGFAATPRLDYIATDFTFNKKGLFVANWTPPIPEELLNWVGAARDGKPPLKWRRQVLFVKAEKPEGANYYVFRDTVNSEEPTFWNFWTYSEKIGTPAQVRHRKRFLTDAPGHTSVAARRLRGDRFTAVGQFGVDTEYYVASPADGKATPRHTLRHSRFATLYHNVHESRDLLNLQLPGEGHYFVALFPRLPSEPVPTFATLGDGKVIKVSGDFGTDYTFLSAAPAGVTADSAAFRGTAGAVQNRSSGLVLSLAASGQVRFKDLGLASAGPATLRAEDEKLSIELQRDHAEQTVTLFAPRSLRLPADVPDGVTLKGHTLSVPRGTTTVDLFWKQ